MVEPKLNWIKKGSFLKYKYIDRNGEIENDWFRIEVTKIDNNIVSMRIASNNYSEIIRIDTIKKTILEPIPEKDWWTEFFTFVDLNEFNKTDYIDRLKLPDSLREIKCTECNGSGYNICDTCEGSGFWLDENCIICGGKGKKKCYHCDGSKKEPIMTFNIIGIEEINTVIGDRNCVKTSYKKDYNNDSSMQFIEWYDNEFGILVKEKQITEGFDPRMDGITEYILEDTNIIQLLKDSSELILVDNNNIKGNSKSAFDYTIEEKSETNAIRILRGYSHRGRFIRFKIKVENNSQYPIRDVKVHLSLPSTLRCESPKSPESTIGDIEAGETLACEFLLKPTACTTATVKGYVVYKDILGEIQTLSIRGKEMETCRPNLEQLPLTFADVTETISSKQLYKDSEHIKLDGIGTADATPLLIKTAEWMNMHHVEDNGHEDQLIFVGRQKVEQTMVIARAAVMGDGVKVRCYVEREDLVAGFLAEFAENLEELVVSSAKPSSDVIWRVMDLFEEIEDTLVYNPSKDQIFTYLNKAHEICRNVDEGISKEIAAFVDNLQMAKDHKDRLDDADITSLKQNIDSWNEVMRGKVD